MRAILALLMCAVATAANRDPAATLARVLQKTRAEMAQIPNYTCVETITRAFYRPLAPVVRACDVMLALKQHPTLDMELRPSHMDRLRLEVAMAEHGEIHAWAGASRFEDSERIDSIVREGPLGTGVFGAFLRSIFDQELKRFHFVNELMADGRYLLVFRFEVPQADSHYEVKLTNSWAVTGYHGSIEVDPETYEVTRLQVETEILPEEAGTCQSTTDLKLAMTAIGSGRFPMATSARQRFVARDGREAVNTTQFSACREYRGESTISFTTEAAGVAAKVGEAPARPLSIPSFVPFTIVLAEAIDPKVAAGGDPFVARLSEPMKDEDGKIIAPRGARVEGRLLRVESFLREPLETIVVMRPEWLEVRGTKVALAAKQDMQRTVAAVKKKTKLEILLPFSWEKNAGLFRFAGAGAKAPKGFESYWRTVAR